VQAAFISRDQEHGIGELQQLLEAWCSEAADSIAVVSPLIYFSVFSAQKSLVKSQNHLNITNKTRSTWHFS
jgi:hypothetical protein